jgi:hypothetical protein
VGVYCYDIEIVAINFRKMQLILELLEIFGNFAQKLLPFGTLKRGKLFKHQINWHLLVNYL